ncbi:hypothetical protein [Legionella fairfieldensis]|uniref:hypothetical protein n=1 Tax=Legionella fairfieldensis TaxID=45064 RepID=UPI00048DBADD|nr:hypothetical protein [Legionella fairfieldensis]
MERYLKILDSFKKHQISNVLRTIRHQLINAIESPYFNAQLKAYFPGISLERKPFTDFMDEPAQIIRIKILLNTLYHAELACKDLETVDLRRGNRVKDLWTLYFHTLDHSTQANALLFKAGMGILTFFGTDIKPLLGLLTQFNRITQDSINNSLLLNREPSQHSFAYKAGLATGITINQLKINHDEFNCSFLIQFSTILPDYLQQATHYIQQYTELSTIKSALNKEKLAILQYETCRLLNSLESLRGNTLFLSARIIYYLDLLRHIIFLSISTLEQVEKMNETSQELVCDKLAQLKYGWLVKLFSLTDYIENEALLAPGTLSKPLMEAIKPFYHQLISYLSNIIDFSNKGQELKIIDDSDFLALRFNETRQRINNAQQQLERINKTKRAIDTFFAILTQPEHINAYLISCSAEIKQNLLKQYKLFEPCLESINSDLNQTIWRALNEESHWTFTTINPWHWFPTSAEKLTNKNLVKSLYNQLENLLEKNAKTQQCYITLNETLIQSAYLQANLVAPPNYDALTTGGQSDSEKYFEPAIKIAQNDTPPSANTRGQSFNYSQILMAFKSYLLQLKGLFNQTINHELEMAQTIGLPFPELEDTDKLLTQSKQVLALKRIFNSLYYLEQLEKELTHLTTGKLYYYHFLEACSHLNEIINLTLALYEDPYLSLLAKNLIEKVQDINQLLKQQSENYIENHHAVITEENLSIKYNCLWYTLNAFTLIPEHIGAISRQTPLSARDLSLIQANTKRVVLKIENIIANADSHFKLLLKTPIMFSLYQELRIKINQFTTTSYNMILTRLEEINTDLFTRILIETDTWEDKLCLKPGKLTDPMKSILDEFYNGLIAPLNLAPQQLLKLANHCLPIEQRIMAVKKIREKIKHEKREYEAASLILQQLKDCIKHFTHFTTTIPSTFPIHLVKIKLIDHYKKALPLFEKEQSLFLSLLENIDSTSSDIDELLNTEVEKEGKPPRNHIVALCDLAFNYYQGLINTCRLNEETANEKMNYLEALKTMQESAHKKAINNFIKKIFAEQLKHLSNQNKPLLHYMNQDYSKQKTAHLQNHYSAILALAQSSDNLVKTVREQLLLAIKRFDQSCLKDYFHLDGVMAVLSQFKLYIRNVKNGSDYNSSLFESATTLNNKAILINELETIALNSNLSVKMRLQMMQKKVDNDQFKAILLDCARPEPFTLAWLNYWLYFLLKLLHIYTPSPVQYYDQLKDALNNKKETAQRNPFKFFNNPLSSSPFTHIGPSEPTTSIFNIPAQK